MNGDYCRRWTRRLLDWVADSGCALKLTIAALLISVAAYVAIHVVHQEKPLELNNALEVSNDGRFKCYYRDDLLDRYFARDRVNQWKQRMDTKSVAFSDEAQLTRNALLLPMRHFIETTFSDGSLVFSAWDAHGTNSGILLVSLDNLRAFLTTHDKALHPAKRGMVEQYVKQLDQQIAFENNFRRRLISEVSGLTTSISFDWFYIKDWKWIIEVVFWCIFGVLANTFITLINATRECRYDAKEFLLVLPKATLAPVIGIVIIAWWATGYSESKITFTNLPYFLVFSFSLGFVTESLYTKIKDLGNLVVGPSATVSAAKLEAAARRDVYQFVHPNVTPETVTPATNLGALRQQLRAAVKSKMERGLVAQMSGSEPPQT